MASHKTDRKEETLGQPSMVTPPKRGRGRPKKQKLDTPVGSDENSRISISCTQEDSLVSASEESPPRDTPGKRGRGRPKKQKVDTGEHVNIDQVQTYLKEKGSTKESEGCLEKSPNETLDDRGHKLPGQKSMGTANPSHTDLKITEGCTQENSSVKPTLETPKRGRGRPKKEKVDTPQESDKNSKTSEDCSKADPSASASAVTPAGNTPGKRGRGRPKKQSMGSEDVRNTEMDLSHSTLEGNESQGAVTEDHGSPAVVTPLKRGRGRPPKHTVESAESSEVFSQKGDISDRVANKRSDRTIPEVPAKRGPGRPRKNKFESPDVGDAAFSRKGQDKVQNDDISVSKSGENHKETVVQTPPTTGRGRPKRQTSRGVDASFSDVDTKDSSLLQTNTEQLHVSQERAVDISHENNSATHTVVKRKRGRPPKCISTDENNENINKSLDLDATDPVMCSTPKGKEEEWSSQCSHCDATFSRLSSYRSHLMSKHHRVYKPDIPEGVFNPLMVLKSMKYIKCLLCSKSYNNMPAFRYHAKWCGRQTETQTCEVCQEVVKAMRFQEHMKKHQPPKPKKVETRETEQLDDSSTSQGRGRAQRKAAQKAMQSFHEESRISGDDSDNGSDCSVVSGKDTEETDSDSDLDSEISAGELDGSSSKQKKKYPKKFKTYNLTRGTIRETDAHKTWPFYPEEEEEGSTENLLADTLQWHKQHECVDIFQQWLPSRDSCKLSEKHTTDSKQSCEISKEIVSSKHGIAKAGQVVWRLAWCPLPLEADTTPTTYLALACNTAASESTDESNDSSPTCSTIQLWSCGELQDSLSTLELSCSIKVDQGRIWDMKWCPTGAWEAPVTEKPSKTTLPRMGLLALALSNGSVDILSVPHTESIPKDAQEGTLHLESEPSVSLVCSPVKESGTQCLCVDWGMKDQCETVCAGFSNGRMAVWKLYAQSSLQREFSDSGQQLLPILTLQAHLGAVTDLALCPNSNCYLASGSVSKEVRVWDLRDMSQPLQELVCSRITKIVWPLNWFSVCAASDNIDSHGNNPVTQVSYGLEASYRTILQHSACVWGVDHSPWLNAIVSCDSGGVICTMQANSVTGRATDRQVLEGRRSWFLEQKNSIQVHHTAAQAKDDVCDSQETSLHCVAWNPNYKSHLWLACGGLNGKVHIKQASANAIISNDV